MIAELPDGEQQQLTADENNSPRTQALSTCTNSSPPQPRRPVRVVDGKTQAPTGPAVDVEPTDGYYLYDTRARPGRGDRLRSTDNGRPVGGTIEVRPLLER